MKEKDLLGAGKNACLSDHPAGRVGETKEIPLRVGSGAIACTIIDAIRGSTLSFPNEFFAGKSYVLRQGRRRIDAEVGCYMSHLKAIRTFTASGDEYGLILEDDVLLPHHFRALLERAISVGGFDMLRLSTVNSGRWTKTIKLDDDYSMGVAFSREKGSGAYLLNRTAARKIVDHFIPMTLPNDIRLDQEWLDGFRTLGNAAAHRDSGIGTSENPGYLGNQGVAISDRPPMRGQ